VEELTIGSSADFVNDSWLKVNEHTTGHVLASTSLREESVEGIIATADSLVRRHLPVGLDPVLEAEKLPTGVTDLDTTLADMNANGFTHGLE